MTLRSYGHTRRGRVWLSYDLHAIVWPQLRICCEGDWRKDEPRSLEVVVELAAWRADPVVACTIDLVGTRLEPWIAEPYWLALKAGRKMSDLRARLGASHTPSRKA